MFTFPIIIHVWTLLQGHNKVLRESCHVTWRQHLRTPQEGSPVLQAVTQQLYISKHLMADMPTGVIPLLRIYYKCNYLFLYFSEENLKDWFEKIMFTNLHFSLFSAPLLFWRGFFFYPLYPDSHSHFLKLVCLIVLGHKVYDLYTVSFVIPGFTGVNVQLWYGLLLPPRYLCWPLVPRHWVPEWHAPQKKKRCSLAPLISLPPHVNTLLFKSVDLNLCCPHYCMFCPYFPNFPSYVIFAKSLYWKTLTKTFLKKKLCFLFKCF